jgi:hypothetical protein
LSARRGGKPETAAATRRASQFAIRGRHIARKDLRDVTRPRIEATEDSRRSETKLLAFV